MFTGGYEVHEHIDEDESFMWHGITAGFGSYSGSRPSSVKIQNKVAPREDQSDRLKASHRMRYQEDEEPPLQNKVAPDFDHSVHPLRPSQIVRITVLHYVIDSPRGKSCQWKAESSRCTALYREPDK